MISSDQFQREAGIELARLIEARGEAIEVVMPLNNEVTEFARSLASESFAHLDALEVRSIDLPGSPEGSIGAVVEDESAIFLDEVNFADPRLLEALNEEKRKLRKNRDRLEADGAHLDVVGKNVLLVDDGRNPLVAIAGARFLRRLGARRILLALPRNLSSTELKAWRDFVDEVLTLPIH